MINLKIPFLTLILCLPFISGCKNNDPRCKLLKGNHVSETIGETVDFNNYISYPSDSSYRVTYVTPGKETVEDETMFYLLSEVGDYSFKFNFTHTDSTSESLSLTLTMLPVAPSIKEAKYVVQVDKGSTVNFSDIITRSGVNITPRGYVDVSFKAVNIIQEYISVENYRYQTSEELIPSGTSSYLFSDYGTYNFTIEASNLSGTAFTSLSAVVSDKNAFGEDIVQSGGIIGSDKDTTVKLLAPSSSSSLSFITYDEEYTLEVGEYMTSIVYFKGQNAPQIMFFADTKDGVIDEKDGFVVSLENAIPYDRLRVFGPNRLKNDIALVERERSFGRDDLKTDTVYQMKTIVSKVSSTEMAVKVILLKKDKSQYVEVGVFDWAKFDYLFSTEDKNIIYLGSKLGNVIFDYSKPYLSDKFGNKIGE